MDSDWYDDERSGGAPSWQSPNSFPGGRESGARRSNSAVASTVYAIYRQIGAVVAAIALLALIGRLLHMDWQGVVAILVSQWDEHLRPPLHWLLDNIVVTPLRWLGWHLILPPRAKDYLSVGIIWSMSNFREFVQRVVNRETRPGDATFREGLVDIALLPLIVLTWPLSALFRFFFLFSYFKDERRKSLLILSPVLYTLLLIVVNYVELGAKP